MTEQKTLTDQDRLDAFLSGKGKSARERTYEFYVKSIDTTIVVRPLDEAEVERITTTRSRITSMLGAQGMPGRERTLAEVNAMTVEAALVSPRFTPEALAQIGVSTVADALRETLLPMELTKLSAEVFRISGMSSDTATLLDEAGE